MDYVVIWNQRILLPLFSDLRNKGNYAMYFNRDYRETEEATNAPGWRKTSLSKQKIFITYFYTLYN